LTHLTLSPPTSHLTSFIPCNNSTDPSSSAQIADFADIFTGRLITEIPLALGALCDALKSHTSLFELNLSDNAFGGRSVDPIVPFLTHNRSFAVFKLNNNGLGPAGGKVIADALRESARLSKQEGKESTLRTVTCGRNRLEDGSATAWADAFAAHGTLEHVSLPQNGIRQEGMIALARGLAKNPKLRVLEIADNAMNIDDGTEGTQAFADALSSWPDLERLDLSDCVLAHEEANAPPSLFDALAKGTNKKLHTLLLQNNNLDVAAFQKLGEDVVGKLPALRRLEVQWNEVEEDEEAVEALRDALVARGGKLFLTDEDEEEAGEPEKAEEEDEETKEEPEPEKGSMTEAEAEAKEDVKTGVPVVDETADDLADLLSKVSISGSRA
jgi:Ran GTPase-activating protein 1